nr:hypothetical protein HUO10_005717 [Paraburkholderia busanensis]
MPCFLYMRPDKAAKPLCDQSREAASTMEATEATDSDDEELVFFDCEAPGGTNSDEHRQAIAFNNGVQRRNSIEQANGIHALQPMSHSMQTSEAQLKSLRNNGAIDATALMTLIHPSTERPWKPNRGEGRQQIRTGRNFCVADSGGGKPFNIRIHTRDNKQANADPTSNASLGAVLRVEQNRKCMLSKTVESTNKMIDGKDWIGAGSRDGTLQNAAHIPVILLPVEALPNARPENEAQ